MATRPYPALAFSLVLIGAAVPTLLGELRPVFSNGHSQSTRMDVLLAGELSIGTSLDARKRALNTCQDTLRDEASWSRGGDARLAMVRACEDAARRILAQSPTDGFAWLIVAEGAVQTGRADEMFEALARSRATAPNELWIAARRVRLGEPMLAWMDDAARAGHDADLLVVARTPRGARSLARRYVGEPAFRARLVALVETLPEQDQIRFLRNVQRQSREALDRS